MIREIFYHFSGFIDAFFIIYFSLINFVYLLLVFFGSLKAYQRKLESEVEDLTPIFRSNSLPEITLIVAAYNEEHIITATIDNLLSITYQHKRILIINDGSTDNTFELIKKKYELVPNLTPYVKRLDSKPIRGIYGSKKFPEILVIDKENGKKYDALNAGLNLCTSPYFITCDADTVIENAYFEKLIRPLLTSPHTIAIGSSIYLRNDCTIDYNKIYTSHAVSSYLIAMQTLEYMRAFLERQGWDKLGGNYVMSGAFSMFLTSAIIECGGYADTEANDLEIILRLNRKMIEANKKYEISYLPDPVAWTEAPDTFRSLARQRMVWQRGLLECAWCHKKMFLNPKYGSFGLFVYPFMVLGEALEPVIEITGYIYIILGLLLNAINITNLLTLFGIIFVFNFILTIATIYIEENAYHKFSSKKTFRRLIGYTLIENFGYRQLHLIWRLWGTLEFLRRFPTAQRLAKSVNTTMKKKF